MSVSDLIASSLGDALRPGAGWEDRVFYFARGMRFSVAGVGDDPATHASHVRAWHAAAVIQYPEVGWTDAWVEYLRSFKGASVPPGDVAMIYRLAADRAKHKRAPKKTLEYDAPCQRLASICRELGVMFRGAPFVLSTRDAAELIGLDRDRDYGLAAKRLRLLVTLKLLEWKYKGKPGWARSKASRFRWIGPEDE